MTNLRIAPAAKMTVCRAYVEPPYCDHCTDYDGSLDTSSGECMDCIRTSPAFHCAGSICPLNQTDGVCRIDGDVCVIPYVGSHTPEFCSRHPEEPGCDKPGPSCKATCMMPSQ